MDLIDLFLAHMGVVAIAGGALAGFLYPTAPMRDKGLCLFSAVALIGCGGACFLVLIFAPKSPSILPGNELASQMQRCAEKGGVGIRAYTSRDVPHSWVCVRLERIETEIKP